MSMPGEPAVDASAETTNHASPNMSMRRRP
jgi:hypothetical protein